MRHRIMNSITTEQQEYLRRIPSLENLLASEEFAPLFEMYDRAIVTEHLRSVIDQIRGNILAGEIDEEIVSYANIAGRIKNQLDDKFGARLVRIINATGTITHTNLGRSLLNDEACQSLVQSAKNYVNLEYNVQAGKRGHRDEITKPLLKQLTGCEASTVVNNNAGAVLLSLNTLAVGKEVIVSRGELIEIGGAFRIPEVMESSGAILREVGTTNRTYLYDYERAINENTALLLKAHPSNYRIQGFTTTPELKEIVELGHKQEMPVMEDLGSGSLIDLTKYGLPHEPVVKERINTGVDIVTFSGDKLLGGPQAGIIIGKEKYITQIRRNPLMRALRVGKLTISALEATLRLYLNEDAMLEKLPMLKFYTRSLEEIRKIAEKLAKELNQFFDGAVEVTVEESFAEIGSGSLPLENIKSIALALSPKSMSAEELSESFRQHEVPIIGRVSEDKFLMDMRTVRDEDMQEIKRTAQNLHRE